MCLHSLPESEIYTHSTHALIHGGDTAGAAWRCMREEVPVEWWRWMVERDGGGHPAAAETEGLNTEAP